jgi:deoxyadenosine/deoxycytidine kinase
MEEVNIVGTAGIGKTTYTPAVKKAIDKYRTKNIQKYNELQRQYYNEAKKDDNWRQKFNERCKENNRIYREKKRLENPPRPKGRPRNPIPIVMTTSIPV